MHRPAAVLVAVFSLLCAAQTLSAQAAIDLAISPSSPVSDLLGGGTSSLGANTETPVARSSRPRTRHVSRGPPPNISWDPLGNADAASEAFHPLPVRAAAAVHAPDALLATSRGAAKEGPQRLKDTETRLMAGGEGDDVVDEPEEREAEQEYDDDDHGDDWDGVQGDMLSEEGWLRRRSRYDFSET